MVRNGDYVKKLSNCVPFVFNKLRDKKYLRFSFDSPTNKETENKKQMRARNRGNQRKGKI